MKKGVANMVLRGVFWVIDDADGDDRLIFKMFEEGDNVGLSKSGHNYNHRLLWEHVRPRGCNKSFDYYPRGRVEMNNKGIPIVYMNMSISKEDFERIKERFCLGDDYKIHYDGSEHYKCHNDY